MSSVYFLHGHSLSLSSLVLASVLDQISRPAPLPSQRGASRSRPVERPARRSSREQRSSSSAPSARDAGFIPVFFFRPTETGGRRTADGPRSRRGPCETRAGAESWLLRCGVRSAAERAEARHRQRRPQRDARPSRETRESGLLHSDTRDALHTQTLHAHSQCTDRHRSALGPLLFVNLYPRLSFPPSRLDVESVSSSPQRPGPPTPPRSGIHCARRPPPRCRSRPTEPPGHAAERGDQPLTYLLT